MLGETLEILPDRSKEEMSGQPEMVLLLISVLHIFVKIHKAVHSGFVYCCINWMPNKNNSARAFDFTILYLREKLYKFRLN